jgi:hypothetical protein
MPAAMELVAEAPGLRLLASACAQQEVARTLVAISQLAHDYPEVAECEVNPLILQENGAIAVDSLIVVGARQSVRDGAVDD